MSQRHRIKMSRAETLRFLADHDKLQVATVGLNGAPHLTTVFYAYLQDRITFWTYATSQKAVNLARDPRITVLVEDGTSYDELRGVVVHGIAELERDPESVRAIGLQLSIRVRSAGPSSTELIAAQAHKRVGVRVRPERLATWDHTKLEIG